jgi:hypothetical protein
VKTCSNNHVPIAWDERYLFRVDDCPVCDLRTAHDRTLKELNEWNDRAIGRIEPIVFGEVRYLRAVGYGGPELVLQQAIRETNGCFSWRNVPTVDQ